MLTGLKCTILYQPALGTVHKYHFFLNQFLPPAPRNHFNTNMMVFVRAVASFLSWEVQLAERSEAGARFHSWGLGAQAPSGVLENFWHF